MDGQTDGQMDRQPKNVMLIIINMHVINFMTDGLMEDGQPKKN